MGKHELRRWHKQLSNAVETMNCGFLVRTKDGRIVYVNDCLLGWLGYERREVEDKPIENLVPSELHHMLHGEIQAITAGDLRVRLTIFQRKDSTTFPVLVVPQCFTDEDDQPLGGLEVIVELASVQTAKPAGYGDRSGLRAELDRIALEIQGLALSASLAPDLTLSLSHPEFQELSPRELEVLVQIVGGDRVPTIAKSLHISPHTVRNHLKAIYRKLGVGSQAELLERVRSFRG